jgi:C1A family cysteine protease
LFKSFDKAMEKGIVPLPKQSETARESHGRYINSLSNRTEIYYQNLFFRHAVLASGYSDASKAFIVRNSWGEGWVSFLINTNQVYHIFHYY